MKSTITLSLISLLIMGLSSCAKYELGLVEDNYAGDVMVTSTGSDPSGDFVGDGDAGTYSFTYTNSTKKADVRFDITTPTGSVQMVVNDAKGNVVLDEIIVGGASIDTFSGLTSEGKSGVWKVTITLIDFDGDGSYSINPA
ncbi:MAG: hypothetical protein IIA45_00105 [Bacteroidetes bacterium]|nr:hypothetical protein [Bacteroidota bacterium]